MNREPGNPISHTILCISHLEWTERLFQRPQQVMLRLSGRYKVTYFSKRYFKQWIGLAGRLNFKELRSFHVNENLFVWNLLMPLPTLNRALNTFSDFNRWWVIHNIKKIAGKPSQNRFVLWCYFPVDMELLDVLNPSLIIYDCMDNYISLSNGNESNIRYLKRTEPYLLERADIIFYGSKFLMDSRKEYAYKSYHLPTGVDFELFSSSMNEDLPLPHDMEGIRKPILGYWGAVDQRIDYKLLYECAIRHPDWSIVLLGPMVEIKKKDIDYFLELPNVHWLGPKPYQLLARYAKAFDVCLLPFKESDEGKYLNPTKTLEYLATGRPVVSSKIPDIETFFSDTVDMAVGENEFVKSVEKRMMMDDERAKDKRLAKAKDYSWGKMVSRMDEIVMSRIKG